MSAAARFSSDDARRIGMQIGIDWNGPPFNVEELRRGMEVELEHGRHDPTTNVTNDDPVVTSKIALAHLDEFRIATRGSSGWKSRRSGRTERRDASARHQHIVRLSSAVRRPPRGRGS
jgi:Protein of unknown function (DUF5661)